MSAISEIKESIKKLSVVELAELVKELEEEFGVTARLAQSIQHRLHGVSAAAQSVDHAPQGPHPRQSILRKK